MNLLFLSMTFPDAVNRARGSYNLALCRALAQEHAVRVCSPRPWPEVLREKTRGRQFTAGPEIHDAGLWTSYPTYWYAPVVTRNQSGRILAGACRKAVDRLTCDWRPDAVVSYWAHPDGEAGLRAAERLQSKSAVIVGGTDALILPYRRGRGPHVRRVLTESSAVLTVSKGLRDAVLRLGADPARVHVLYQGVDLDTFHSGSRSAARRKLNLPNTRPILVWVGRMVDIKRLDVLIAAVAVLRDRGCDFELCLVGDGECRKAAEANARRLKLTDRVRFVGSVPYRETADWYRAADATVLCSDSEGLPNVLRESLACGTPFVSTDVGSIREIAMPEASLLTPAGDVSALAEGMERILADDYRIAAQCYRARSWSDCAADLADILEVRTPGPMSLAREEVLAP
jgi:glycosyltransferase involved in cell wall biosynthesis